MRVFYGLFLCALGTLLVTTTSVPLASAQTLPAPLLREVVPLPDGVPPTPEPDPDPDPVPGGSKVTFKEDPNDILNPERGIFRTGWARLDGSVQDHTRHRNEFGSTIAYDRIYMQAYKTVDTLPSSFINAIRANLAAVRNSGVKVAIRFAYDTMGSDATKARMLKHISQLKPTFHDYADVIAWVEIGFVGYWGEWHSSTNVSISWNTEPGLTNAKDLADAMFTAVPKGRMVAFRYPIHLRGIFGGNAVTSSNAYGGSNIARAAIHNDCLLYNNTDRGTFQGWDLANERTFTEKQTAYSFTVGETCGFDSAVTSRSNCSVALDELARFHWVALNDGVYVSQTAVLDKWRSQGCYETIKKRLGYRFVLVDAVLPENAQAGSTVEVNFRIRNDGFARAINSRTAYASLISGSTRRDIALKANLQSWAPGITVTVREAITLPSDLPQGTYKLAVWLPDPASTLKNDPRQAIRFANTGTWESSAGANTLGTFGVYR